MKNISVGKKMFLCFGLIIVLIAAMLGVTLLNSLTSQSNLRTNGTLSSLSTAANTVLDSIDNARVELRTVYTSSGDAANTAYTVAVGLLNQAKDTLPQLRTLITQLSGPSVEVYTGATDELTRLIPELLAKVEAVHANDLAVVEATAEMDALSVAMSDKATYMIEVLSDAIADSGEIERINSALVPAHALNDLIAELRVAATDLTKDQNTESVSSMTAMLDTIETDADALLTQLVRADNVQAANELMEAVAAYRAKGQELITLLESSATLATEARTITDTLQATISGGVEYIDAEIAEANASSITSATTTLFISMGVAVAAAVVSLLVGLYLTRAVTRPLNKMKEVMLQAGGTGNLNFSEEVRNGILAEATAKDEFGQSIGAFAQFVDRMRYIGDGLEAVAARDLTITVDLLSPEDTMGNALAQMLDNLNSMFAEINSVSSQVATSSGEIAQGAQSLAQGSTEQASTIQEISASINEITEQSKVSAATAGEAASYSNSIRSVAQEGNDKMGSMMGAVQEINTASQAIGNVIKVIDDIAFQTNILALNAAVEAARAGEHGKGFAVVADEVRNLAGKSADAAKETSVLISANIEKAELGLSISQETAEALARIVEGIQQTSESLVTIANQAEASQTATAQVNLAVDQVGQVVQQNSATSEQSAAASEEMSSQAQVLQQLVARFKLRGGQGGGYNTPGQSPALPAASAQGGYTASSGDIIF